MENINCYENISTCKKFAEIICTVYGPKIRNKIVINHFKKQLSLSTDDKKKIPELDVNNPVIRILIEESERQEKEACNGNNFVILFCGALLEKSSELLEIGFTCDDIISLYNLALMKALGILETLKFKHNNDRAGADKSSIQEADNYGFKEAIKIFQSVHCESRTGNGNVENQLDEIHEQQKASCSSGFNNFIHTDQHSAARKIESSSHYHQNRDTASENKIRFFFKNYKPLIKAKTPNFFDFIHTDSMVQLCAIAVYNCPVTYFEHDRCINTTVNDRKTLEHIYHGLKEFDNYFNKVVEAYASVVISYGKLDDFAKFYLKERRIMGISCQTRFDINRICRLTASESLNSLLEVYQKDLCVASIAYKENVAGTLVAVFKARGRQGKSVVVEDISNQDADSELGTSKSIRDDNEFVPGGGASEIEMAMQLKVFKSEPFENRLAFKKFADALEVIPKVLAENTYVGDINEVRKKLYEAHNAGKKNFGINTEIKKGESCIVDALEYSFLDLYKPKMWGLRCGVDAAAKILKLSI